MHKFAKLIELPETEVLATIGQDEQTQQVSITIILYVCDSRLSIDLEIDDDQAETAITNFSEKHAATLVETFRDILTGGE